MTRTSRRSAKAAAAAAAASLTQENDNDADMTSARSRRSTRARKQTVLFEATAAKGSPGSGVGVDNGSVTSEGAEDSDDEVEELVAPDAPRRSSRSTAFKGGMKDPSSSIADLLKAADGPAAGSGGGKRRGARAPRSSLEGADSEEEEEDYGDSRKKKRSSKEGAGVKSPAKRHSRRRMSKRLEYPVDESSEEEESEDEGFGKDESEDEDEMKFSKIIACKSMPLKEWKAVCGKMNTTEITNGSRWVQENEEGDSGRYEERFLVKWNDLSFLHCSWETERDLVEFCEGAKGRMSTFFRKAEGGLLYGADERLDGDYFDPSWITIERVLDATDDDEDREPAEIILDVNDPGFEDGTGRQFYVKWVNKPYSESSYEFERDLILNEVDYKEHVESYDKRKVKPTRKEMSKRDRESDKQWRQLYKTFGEKIKQSDEARDELVKGYQKDLEARVYKNGGQLRDYQAEGVSWLMSNHLNKRNSILADEMGLGKTIQTATYIYTVSQQLTTRGPFLIVAPLSTIPHWYREFTGWTDLNTIIYHGSANDRERAREDEFAFPQDRVQDVAFNSRYLAKVAKGWHAKWEKTWMVEVVITTPEMLVTEDFLELAALRWEILVVDEAHRLKNHNSKLAQNLRDERFQFKHSLLLTGTPIQNNMQELWTLLNFINPETFDNLDGFMEHYGDIKSKDRVDELHETIRPYILRRLKEDVEKSVPPKEETLIEVELTVLQKQYYRALYEKNLKFLHRNKKKPLDGPSINNLAMQLRKCCNHPFLLTGVETEVRAQNPNADMTETMVNASGKFVLLDKLLPRLKADGHRILLFSQFKIMLDIIEDYLHLRCFKCERIDGSITGLKRQAAIDRFQSKDVTGARREMPFIMLLSTRAGGVGINLTAADTCIIFDSDWNPQNDLQAQARCHRIGQTKNVKIYRLLTRKTYEMQMFHMSSMKMGLDQAVLQGIENNGEKGIMTKEEVEKLLKHGAYDIFKEDQDGTSEKESNDFISQNIDSILARCAKTVVHENTGSNSNAAGGTFSKASFKNTSSDGVAAAEVDVDDPDFWTKVVGEAKDDEKEQIGKRKRVQQSYSEKEYSKRLDAAIREGVGSDIDGNVSLSSEDSSDSGDEDDSLEDLNNEALKAIHKATKVNKNRERYLWGGSGQAEWKQLDAEAVLRVLTSFGYGNIPWTQFKSALSLSKPMKQEEIKRMCWALPLLCLLEAAEDDALEVTRKAKAASREKQHSGDVLAHPTGDTGNVNDDKESSSDKECSKSGEKLVKENDPLEGSFKKLLSANKLWAGKALSDASSSSKTFAYPRDKDYVQSLINAHPQVKIPSEESSVEAKLSSGFAEYVWPALRSRGWKNDDKNKSKGYTYQGKVFQSIIAVLDEIPKYHPELTNMINSLIASVSASCSSAADGPGTTLDLHNVTASSLKLFLTDCAPLQLLVDRKRPHRIGLSKRLLTQLVLTETLHNTVSTADSSLRPEASLEERNVQLSKLISIHPLTSLPHPEWTLLHDAILIRAVTKHGWIDRQSTCTAIDKDKTICWGVPFEAVPYQSGKEKKKAHPNSEKKFQADYNQLFATASRAVNFIRKLNENFIDGEVTRDWSSAIGPSVVNELRERLIKSFRLVKSSDEDEMWKVDGDELKKILRPPEKDVVELPSRKKLVKRIKKLAMSFKAKGSAPDEEKDDTPQVNSASDTKIESKSYGFHVLDQSNCHNVLLAEMIRGQIYLKQATKVNMVKYYTGLIFAEINARIIDLAKCDRSTTLLQGMQEIRKDIQLFSDTFKRGARAAKNILRVMLGIDPIQPKGPTEPLFATEMEKPSTRSILAKSAKASLAKLKNKKARTPADTALNRALSLYVEDKDGLKDCLLLTSTEILMLTVMASQGLPVFSDDWHSLISSAVMLEDDAQDEEEFIIYFSVMGGIIQAAAEVWLSIAKKKLKTELDLHIHQQPVPEKGQARIAVLKKDLDAKVMTLEESKVFSNDPLLFAKKCVMLVEAIRKNMGPLDLNYAGEKKIRQLNKSENGLGTKVLAWFSKDLNKWAGPLGAAGKGGNLLSTTSITRKKDHPQSHDAALMTKRDCRTVFIQIAQQTRLRSIFSKHKMARLSNELIPKVMNQSSFTMTHWEEIPTWWNKTKMDDGCCCRDDLHLLIGILDYGYGAFDSLLEHDYPFCKQLVADYVGESNALTKATVQVRVNHLTRELHALDETEEMMKLVQKRKGDSERPDIHGKAKKVRSAGCIQSGLQAFFKQSTTPNPAAGSKKERTPPTSPEKEGSDIEIIDIDSNNSDTMAKKRKHDFDCVTVAEKKQK